MTASRNRSDVIGGRYRIERIDRAIGSLRRAVGIDQRLDRPVLLWLSDASGAEEDALLEVARSAGQSDIPSFLRVLDVTYDDDGVAVVLESAGASLAAAAVLTPIDGRSARALLEAIADAKDDALTLARVDSTDILTDTGEVSADPIALFLPLAPSERAMSPDDLRARLGALLIEHAEDATALARAIDSLDGAVHDDRAGARASAALNTTGAPYHDEEPTLDFAFPSATAAVPAEPPRAAAAPAPRVVRESPPAPTPTRVVEAAPVRAPRRAMPWRVFVPLYAGLAVIVAGAIVFAVRGTSDAPPAASTAAASQNGGAPVVAPAAGHVTVGIAAKEDSGVRVTVDGVVQFDGTLNAGQRQSWDGKQRIDVWTDKGKTLVLAVNGRDLGPYSPAMNHPDWNRIDFSFWPGWIE